MAGSTRSSLRVLAASMRTYALDVLALYSTWGFILVRLSVPAFMIATAWALSRIASPGSLLSGLGYTDYTGYVALGIAFYSMLTATLFEVGERLHRELVQGTLETLLVTPAGRAPWLLGNALGSLAISLIDVILVALYYWLVFGLDKLHPEGVPGAALAVLLGLAGMTGLGVLLAGIVLNLKEPHAFNVMLTPFLMLLSGMMFPVGVLPQPLREAAGLLPLTHAIEAVRRSLLQGHTISMIQPLLEALAVQAVVYLALGLLVFRVLESWARRSGGLVKY